LPGFAKLRGCYCDAKGRRAMKTRPARPGEQGKLLAWDGMADGKIYAAPAKGVVTA
jgi:hypothetical protein